MFQTFPKLTRFSHGWTITEKIDGTNAAVVIMKEEEVTDFTDVIETLGGYAVFAQSRTRLITPKNDNAGFASWVAQNTDDLVEILGEGRHFGEWCGNGIQRTYGLKEKRFALFNTHRWGTLRNHSDGGLLNGRLTVVPTLASGYMEDPGAIAAKLMESMREHGSVFAPGFFEAEGVVMRHNPSNTIFKKTFDYDESGKWAENQARKA